MARRRRPGMIAAMQSAAASPPLSAKDLERARGDASVRARLGPGGHAIADLAQSGCARLLFPARALGAPLEAVVVNTGGGLTGGDCFSVQATVEAGAALTMTTQACEKVYAAADGPAYVATRLSVASGARLHWLPQETILFERSALRRSLSVDMAEDAELLVAEGLLLGRQAMGEVLSAARFRDSWRIRRAGRLVFAEEAAAGWSAGWEPLRRSAALLGPETAALATIVHVSPVAEKGLDGARAIMDSCDVAGGASAFDGLLTIRLAAPSGIALRRASLRLIEFLSCAPPPRVWTT